MKKRLIILLALLMLITSACSPANETESVNQSDGTTAVITNANSANSEESEHTEDASEKETTASTKPTDPTEITAESNEDAETQQDTYPVEDTTLPDPFPAETSSPAAETTATTDQENTESTVQLVTPTEASLEKKQLIQSGTILNYWLYTPQNATENMPLIVYLHGGSGKGDDLDILMRDGFPKHLKDGSLRDVPAYIVIPQLSSNLKGWTDIKEAICGLVDYCENTYGIDSSKISLTGHSMGGTGTWGLALAYPALFSRIAPMSGSITTNDVNLKTLSNMPVWAFVGSADTIVKPDSSIRFISALQKMNSNAEITVFDGADHFSVPELAYLDREIGIMDWLITN